MSNTNSNMYLDNGRINIQQIHETTEDSERNVSLPEPVTGVGFFCSSKLYLCGRPGLFYSQSHPKIDSTNPNFELDLQMVQLIDGSVQNTG